MKPWNRTEPETYEALGLRASELLRDVPLHDVWSVDLPGGGDDTTLLDVRTFMDLDALMRSNAAVRALFRLRQLLGRLFRWDDGRVERGDTANSRSYLLRLTPADRANSLVPPGSADGAFTVLYVHRHEAVNEIRNATVHAFSVLALSPRRDGCRLFWAIHVAPVGRITRAYMALIDPFRRWIIYPAILRHVHRTWCDAHGGVP